MKNLKIIQKNHFWLALLMAKYALCEEGTEFLKTV
jgi:hypothetical protein